ncbi:hypothetical protein [Streptomyces sp. NPDC048521]
MTEDLNAVLARLDAWLESHAPADHAALNPPAAQEPLEALRH